MKTILAALASASLLAAPLALGPTPAMAQHSHGGGHGGGFSHGGFSHGGSFHGGFGRGGGFARGGFGHGGGGFYRGGGHYHGGGYYYGDYPYYAGAAFGLFLGAAVIDSWYDDYPAYYGDYGYYGAYGGPDPDDYDGLAPYADDPNGPPPPQYQAAPEGQPQGPAQPQACGSWNWNAAQGKYNWVGC